MVTSENKKYMLAVIAALLPPTPKELIDSIMKDEQIKNPYGYEHLQRRRSSREIEAMDRVTRAKEIMAILDKEDSGV